MSLTRACAFAVAVTTWSAFVACSGSSADAVLVGDGGAPDSGTSIGADQATSDAANAYCSKVQSCAPAYVTLAYGDLPTCVTAFEAALTRELAGNGVVETSTQLETCATALRAAACADLLGRKPPAACKAPPGTLADGAACGADAQCVNTRCLVGKNQICGVCGAHAVAGGACVVDDDCEDGDGCTDGKCVVYGTNGSACDATHLCRSDLACKAGVCGAPAEVGAACTDSSECDEANGVACGSPSKKCEAATFASAGGACGLVAGQLVLCRGPGGVCSGAKAPNYTGMCLAAAAIGAPCNTSSDGPSCGAAAVCVCTADGDGGCAGTCALPDPSACH